METLKKLLDFLNPLPAWLRVVIAALVTVVISICILMTACTVVSSCGITQSVVNNIESDGNTIEMGVTPSTTTSTTISPDVQFGNPNLNGFYLFTVLLFFSFSNGKPVKSQYMIEASCEMFARNKLRRYIDSEYSSFECFFGYNILRCIRFFNSF